MSDAFERFTLMRKRWFVAAEIDAADLVHGFRVIQALPRIERRGRLRWRPKGGRRVTRVQFTGDWEAEMWARFVVAIAAHKSREDAVNSADWLVLTMRERLETLNADKARRIAAYNGALDGARGGA